MNFRGDELHEENKAKGKRNIFEVEEKLPIHSFQKQTAVIDSFGAINNLPIDRFGAVQVQESVCSSIGSTSSRLNGKPVQSTASFRPIDDHAIQDIEDRPCTDLSISVNESTWNKYIESGTRCSATSFTGTSRIFTGPQSNCSTPRSCTLDERTSTISGGSPSKRLCTFLTRIVDERKFETRPHSQPSDPRSTQRIASEQAHNDISFSRVPITQAVDTRIAQIRTPTVRFNIDETILRPGSPAVLRNIERPVNVRGRPGEQLDLNVAPRTSVLLENPGNSSESRRLDNESNNYRFVSAEREATLRQRMDERQRFQDACPMVTSLPESHGAERCRHVVSPEDLVWVSVKNYCGMVLDRETQFVLGTAIMFVDMNRRSGKSAWVTSLKTVQGRREVLIKNSRGEIHIAKLMLTSLALGVKFFEVNVSQGTFALAFLSMVTGPARLPYREFTDVDQGDRVYVFGHEEPWESESGKIADIRVRPGNITYAGKQDIVEINFGHGRLGGSINTPSGFRGGLVVRADGVWAGVITGQTLDDHPNQIDFSSAYNIYSLLEEL